jgi:hypothetical protein
VDDEIIGLIEKDVKVHSVAKEASRPQPLSSLR